MEQLFKKGRGFFRVARNRPGRIYHWWQAESCWELANEGNSYLRRLFVQGARAVLQQAREAIFRSACRGWAQLTARTHSNVAAVALANKLARMAWAVLAKNEPYRPPNVGRRSYSRTGLQMTPG